MDCFRGPKTGDTKAKGSERKQKNRNENLKERKNIVCIRWQWLNDTDDMFLSPTVALLFAVN